MFDSISVVNVARKFVVYLFGIAAAVSGALGLAGAIELSTILSAGALTVGIFAVLFVHEYLDGPI